MVKLSFLCFYAKKGLNIKNQKLGAKHKLNFNSLKKYIWDFNLRWVETHRFYKINLSLYVKK